MKRELITASLKAILQNMPDEWASLTTHRLDIYDESRAKSQFLEELAALAEQEQLTSEQLAALPTAYDYTRLGHQLSSIFEWAVATRHSLDPSQVISFASRVMPILAVLRTDAELRRETVIYHDCELPRGITSPELRRVYGYSFQLQEIQSPAEIKRTTERTSLYVTSRALSAQIASERADIVINIGSRLGSVLLINNHALTSAPWVSKIQHVRRRETIAPTPNYSLKMLKALLNEGDETFAETDQERTDREAALASIYQVVEANTGSAVQPQIGSSGLSVQYAVLMGLVDYARSAHPQTPIRFLIPPNCYGGTHNQARRIAALADDIEVVDLPVDSGSEMTTSLKSVLAEVAQLDALSVVLVEIPTNPRVEVPDLTRLAEELIRPHNAPHGGAARRPIFVVDQTFCPNVKLLSDSSPLASIETLSYVSGSKFPSAGHCTAGYVTANTAAAPLMSYLQTHLELCENLASPWQLEVLARQMPSMNQRITQAYHNTKRFVDHIQARIPQAKINFVDDALADQGFTPSVFSLDLPSRGETPEERERVKRELNQELISHMVTRFPQGAKHCVSYGQLHKTYWTIPATSTQGTTQEADKDYIVRVALPPQIDMEALLARFDEFCRSALS